MFSHYKQDKKHQYPAEIIEDALYAGNQVNLYKTEFICLAISTLSLGFLKLVDQFKFLSSSAESMSTLSNLRLF